MVSQIPKWATTSHFLSSTSNTFPPYGTSSWQWLVVGGLELGSVHAYMHCALADCNSYSLIFSNNFSVFRLSIITPCIYLWNLAQKYLSIGANRNACCKWNWINNDFPVSVLNINLLSLNFQDQCAGGEVREEPEGPGFLPRPDRNRGLPAYEVKNTPGVYIEYSAKKNYGGGGWLIKNEYLRGEN